VKEYKESDRKSFVGSGHIKLHNQGKIKKAAKKVSFTTRPFNE